MSKYKEGWSPDHHIYTTRVAVLKASSWTLAEAQAMRERRLAIEFNKFQRPAFAAYHKALSSWKNARYERYLLRRELYRQNTISFTRMKTVAFLALVAVRSRMKRDWRVLRKYVYILYKYSKSKYATNAPDYSDRVYDLASSFPNRKIRVDGATAYISRTTGTRGLLFNDYLSAYCLLNNKLLKNEFNKELISDLRAAKKRFYSDQPKLPKTLPYKRPLRPESRVVEPRIPVVKKFCNPYYVKSVSRTHCVLQHRILTDYGLVKQRSSITDGPGPIPYLTRLSYLLFNTMELYIPGDTGLANQTKYDALIASHQDGVDELHNTVLARIGEKYRGSGFNTGNFIVESDETLNFLLTSIKNLTSAITKLRSGNVVGALRAIGVDYTTPRKFLKTLAGADLMYSYALTPLISDVHNAAEAYASSVIGKTDEGLDYSNPVGYRLRSSKSYISSTTLERYGLTFELQKKSTYRIIVRLGGQFSSDNHPQQWLVDPFQSLWEGTFLSFVIDWAINIQTFLEAMWVVRGNMNITDAMYSLKETESITCTNNVSSMFYYPYRVPPGNPREYFDDSGWWEWEGSNPGPHTAVQVYGSFFSLPQGVMTETSSFRRGLLNNSSIMPHAPKFKPMSKILSMRHVLNGLSLVDVFSEKAAMNLKKSASRIAYKKRLTQRHLNSITGRRSALDLEHL